MSSMTSVLVRPSGAARQITAPSGFTTPTCRLRWKPSRVGPCAGGKLVVTRAGLGRYSGALHGSRSKNLLRRKPCDNAQDEHNERELDKLEDHGADVRGAYGDVVAEEPMSSELNNRAGDEPMVDQFHSDGTSDDATTHDTHFEVSYQNSLTSSQSEAHFCSILVEKPENKNRGGHGERTDNNAAAAACSESGGGNTGAGLRSSEAVGEEDPRVEPITVLDGSGMETRSYVDSNLGTSALEQQQRDSGDREKTEMESVSGNGEGRVDSADGTSKFSNVDGTEYGRQRNGADVLPAVPRSPVEGKGEADRSKNGTAKPSMQRRNSRGRKKKLPSSFGADPPPPVILFPEEVAPVAATILTNPDFFMDSDESRASASSDADSGRQERRASPPFFTSRLKAYDKATMGSGLHRKQRSMRAKEIISAMDTMSVRTPTLEAERPVQVAGSVATASANVGSREKAREDVPAGVQLPDFDVNQSNGHIQQRRKKAAGLLAGLPRHVRPKRPSDAATDPATKLESEHAPPTGSTTESPQLPLPLKLVTELPSKFVELPVKVVKDLPVKVAELPVAKVAREIPAVAELPAVLSELPAKVAEIPARIVVETAQILKAQVVEPVVEILPDAVVEQVGAVVEQVAVLQTQVSGSVSRAAGQVKQIGQNLVDHVTDGMHDSLVDHNNSISRLQEQVSNQIDQVSTKVSEQVSEVSSQVMESVSSTAAQVTESVSSTVLDVTESVQSTAAQVSESVSSTAAQVTESVQSMTESVQSTATKVQSKAAEVSSSIVDFLSNDDEDSSSDDEFETFKTSDSPEFRGLRGLQNFEVIQEDEGIFFAIYDFYIYMLKKPLPQFACGMFAAPVLLSVVFTFLYLPDCKGLALDETARSFFDSSSGEDASGGGLTLSWTTLFQVFMFSLSLSTGLQPELAPLSPYTLVLANINALIAQLIFVFLSGAVFARLSQPSQPVRCSKVALICPSLAQRRRRVDSSATKVLMARYVLAGPHPCELVDVKVDLTYKYNTLTRSGSFFRATQSLKLVRSEIAYLNQGMLVRHIIDESSPLYRRTHEMLRREDAIFTLSVVGLERSSMQSVFHVQHYCVCDNDVVWDAEFEDMMLISKKNKRIVDHSKLSLWRPV